ncbi:MAG: Rpp14/Pop5 family protein [Candidatus Ranarchaeia archaeon]
MIKPILPMAVIPPNEKLVDMVIRLDYQRVFVDCLSSQRLSSIKNKSIEIFPRIRLPEKYPPKNAHKFKTQLYSSGTPPFPLIYAFPVSYQQFQQSIRHPDVDMVLSSIKDLPGFLNQSMIKEILSYQKIMLLDLTPLLTMVGIQRARLINRMLQISHFLTKSLHLIPVTWATDMGIEYIRPSHAILSFLSLLQIPHKNILGQQDKIIDVLRLALDPNTTSKAIQEPAPERQLMSSSGTLKRHLGEDNSMAFPFPLPPIWKPKPRIPHRYLLIQLYFPYSPLDLDAMDIQRQLNSIFRHLYGEITSAHTHLRVLRYDKEKHSLIVRTTPITMPHTCTLFSLLTHLFKTPVIPRIIKVSGTIKGLSS